MPVPRAAPAPPASSGLRRFEARLEGYRTAQVVRELNAGGNPPIELVLHPGSSEPSGPDEPEPPEEPEARPLPVLFVESATEGASVSIDGAPSRSLPLRLELGAGEHELRIEAQGHMEQTRQVTVPEQGELRVEVALVPLAVTTSHVDASTSDEREGRFFWRGPWPWVIGGIVVAGATATVLGVTLSDDEPSPLYTMELR